MIDRLRPFYRILLPDCQGELLAFQLELNNVCIIHHPAQDKVLMLLQIFIHIADKRMAAPTGYSSVMAEASSCWTLQLQERGGSDKAGRTLAALFVCCAAESRPLRVREPPLNNG